MKEVTQEEFRQEICVAELVTVLFGPESNYVK